MKPLTFILTFYFYLISSISVIAQKEDNYETQVKHIYSTLDTTELETGLFADIGFPFKDMKLFNGTREQKRSVILEDYELAHKAIFTMFNSQKPNLPDIEAIGNLESSAKNVDIIPVNALLYHYEVIREDALEKDLINIRNNQVYKTEGEASPFEKKLVFALIPSINETIKKEFTFQLDKNHFYSNLSTPIAKLEIDFGDGNGFRKISWDTPIKVNYQSSGNKIIESKVYMENEKIFYAQSAFTIKDEINLYAYDENNGDEQFTVNTTIPGRSGFNSALVTIDYGENSNFKLDKPIIVVEGLDPSDFIDNRNITDLQDYRYFVVEKLERTLSFKAKLESDGYDIVHVDLRKNTDYIQNNALLLIDVIKEVNRRKANVAGAEQNVVMGLSMGALIARYALKTMENNGDSHDARLYISYDSPHEGANQPIASQYALDHFYNETIFGVKLRNLGAGKDAKQAYQLLQSPAVQQMLVNHISGNSLHNSFYNELNNLGMPNQTRNIAVGNGSWNVGQGYSPGSQVINFYENKLPGGWKQLAIGILGIFIPNPWIATSVFVAGTTTVQINLDLWAVKGSNLRNKVYEGVVREMLFGVIPLDWNAKVTRYFTSKYAYDSWPGSYEEINPGGGPQITFKSSFMSPSTVIGADFVNSYKDFRFTSNQQDVCVSIFDKWEIATNINYTHAEFNQQATDFLWEEIHTNRSNAKCAKLCNAYITGPLNLCSESTFSIANLPDGATVDRWTKNNLVTGFTTGNNSAKFKPSGTGRGYVGVYITIPGCGIARLNYHFDVGKPSLSGFYPSGPSSRSTYQYGYYTVPTAQGGTFQVMKILRNGSVVATGNSNNIGYTFTEVGNYRVIAEASNSCGTISSGINVAVGGSGGGDCPYYLEITSSNPSSSIFQYRIIAPPVEEPCMLLEEEESSQSEFLNSITILDQYGNTIINQNIDQEVFEIDLTHKETGVYFVRVKWNGQELSDRIMKN